MVLAVLALLVPMLMLALIIGLDVFEEHIFRAPPPLPPAPANPEHPDPDAPEPPGPGVAAP